MDFKGLDVHPIRHVPCILYAALLTWEGAMHFDVGAGELMWLSLALWFAILATLDGRKQT